MKKGITLFLIIFLCTVTLTASGEEECTDFFGFNTWYHQQGDDYCGRSNFSNGKYQIISYLDDSNKYYLSVDNEHIYFPFGFSIFKYTSSCIAINTGEGAAIYSCYNFDISNNKASVKITGDYEGDVVSPVVLRKTSKSITLSYKLKEFDHILNDDYCTERVGSGKIVNVVDEFTNKGTDFLHYVIVQNMYEAYFRNIENNQERIKKLIPHFNKPELRILRNLLYAMNNYKFKSSDLNNLFRRFHWYTPEITESSQINFTPAEKEILEFIIMHENR